MPKETVETTTTEVIERTEKEDIIICDDCGMDGSDREMHEFYSKNNALENIYFCKKCLSNNSISSISSGASFGEELNQRIDRRDKIEFVLWCAVFLNPAIIGGIFSGITGFLIGTTTVIPTFVILYLIMDHLGLLSKTPN